MSTGTSLWQDYWAGVGNEEWLAARQLLEVSDRVRSYFFCYLHVASVPMFDQDFNELDKVRHELVLDWQAAADRIHGEGFSSTEYHLARLVTALTTGEPVELQLLTQMGSWSAHVWRVLLEWGTVGPATPRSTP